MQENPLQRARVSGSSAAAAPDRAVLEVPRGIPCPATAVRPAGEVGVGRVPGAAVRCGLPGAGAGCYAAVRRPELSSRTGLLPAAQVMLYKAKVAMTGFFSKARP